MKQRTALKFATSFILARHDEEGPNFGHPSDEVSAAGWTLYAGDQEIAVFENPDDIAILDWTHPLVQAVKKIATENRITWFHAKWNDDQDVLFINRDEPTRSYR